MALYQSHPGAGSTVTGQARLVIIRRGAPGRCSRIWRRLKSKNPESEAVRREREEEWSFARLR